jgi:hypothetical protein
LSKEWVIEKRDPTNIQSAEIKYLSVLQDWAGTHTVKVEENFKYIQHQIK